MVGRWVDEWMREDEGRTLGGARLYVDGELTVLIELARSRKYTLKRLARGKWIRDEREFPTLEAAKAAA